MKSLKAIVLIIFLLLFGATNSLALFIVPNGGFENANFSNWAVGGDSGKAQIVKESTAYNGTQYLPTEGDYFAELNANASIRNMELITWNPGDVLKFDWAFLAMDKQQYNDFGRFNIRDSNNNLLYTNTLSSVGSTGSYKDTGWNHFSYEFTETGSGYFYWMAINVVNNQNDSVLLVDFVHDPPLPDYSNPVPEPSSMLLLGTGLIYLTAGVRKKFLK